VRFTALGLFVASLVVNLAAQSADLTVDRIWGTADFANDFISIRWMRDGVRSSVLVREGDGQNLYLVDAATGSRELLLRGADLVPPGAPEPLSIEGYEFSADDSKILIFTDSRRVWRSNTRGAYWVWDFSERRLLPVGPRPGNQMFAKFSPNASSVAFVRDNDLYVADLATGLEKRLTTDGSEDVINGTTDWVYEEELDLRDAFRWSPDGSRIAFWRFDQSAIEPFHLLDETVLYPKLASVRYPKAGTPNSDVKIGVFDLATATTAWIDVGSDNEAYVARMDFTNSSTNLWLQRLNRHQNRIDLLVADVRDGSSRVVMSDTDEAWLDVHEPLWIDNGRRFLLLSERDGFAQLYLYERGGSLVRKITTEPWDVTTVHGVNERQGVVYFSGAGEGPLQRHVYRIGLDGRDLHRLSTEAGSHSAAFSPSMQFYLDTHSQAGRPPTQTLRDADGALVRVLAANDSLRARVAALDVRRPEFLQVPLADGTLLNAYVIKPVDFDSTKRYPLLMHVYGGPGSQTVRDAWGGANYLWHQMLAREGYLVASVDNRGTGARGRDFKKATYLRLGELESNDQIAAARWFASLPWVDGSRVGIWGWSYGGYMSSLSLFRGGGVFRTAIAVAPVSDWRLYDTIYTERYMRTPVENPDGYEKGAPLTYADRLEGSLLLVHGTGDDNVHPQNTLQLVDRLITANKQFELRLYPNRTHSIAGPGIRTNLYTMLTDYLKRTL
jgi:dipeptidyl-peptidase-4